MQAENRLAVVTGTSSGIGLAAARVLLKEGWTVVGLARRPAAFEDPGYQHLTFDLAQTAELESFADEHLVPLLSDQRWQRVGLVNNAAVIGSLRALPALSPVQLAEVLATNAVAPIWLMGLAARVVSPQADLRIVNISSGAAGQGIAGLADYCASKAALRLAGMALGQELAQGAVAGRQPNRTGILSYEPGVVETSMQDTARAASPAEFPSHEVFQGFAERGDLLPTGAVVGELVAFLSATGGEIFTERRFGVT